ncbi:MAG: hypothetical protein HZB15_17160 [Actinobacteria bacterium]|nr:hypothetical protein [Actinomycetota bacterium]
MVCAAALVSCADGEAAERVAGAVDVVDDTALAATDPGVVQQVSGVACQADRATLEVAIEAYVALYGDAPVDEQQLVDAGLLRDVVPGWDLGANGAVVPAAACG